MLSFGNKEFRNLQEQVLFNSNELRALRALQTGGLDIAGIYATYQNLPLGETGKGYLVGTEKPYNLYIKLVSGYYELGEFPAKGPQGITGLKGDKGDTGEKGTIWLFGSQEPNLEARTGDFYFQFDGKIWAKGLEGWYLISSIRGPQGPRGERGPIGDQGEMGPRGEKGERGVVGPVSVVKGILTNISQLPNPDLVVRNSAYLIGGQIFVIVGDEELEWYNAGLITEYTDAFDISYDGSFSVYLIATANVQEALSAVDAVLVDFEDRIETVEYKQEYDREDIDLILTGNNPVPKAIADATGANIRDSLDDLADDIQGLDGRVSQAEEDIDTSLNIGYALQNEVNKIEETLRKASNGEVIHEAKGTNVISLGYDSASAPVNVKIDGGILQAEQLIENGDFSNGTTGWNVYRGVGTVNNDMYTITGNTSDDFMAIFRDDVVSTTDLYYIYGYLMTPNTVVSIRITGDVATPVVIASPVANTWYFLSGIKTMVSTRGRHQIQLNNTNILDNVLNIKNTGKINITNLKNNKQYSPLYDSTFDLMTDEQIKLQMDAWVNDGTLPNDSLLSVSGNKKITSIGSNLFNKGTVLRDKYLGPIGNELNATNQFVSDYINVKPNGTYTLNNVISIAQFDSEKVFIRNNYTSPFTVANNCNFIKFDGTLENLNIITLNEGTTALPYEPYKSTELYLNAPNLYGLPNGVKDTIEYRNGKYYHIQRVKKYTLTSGDIQSFNVDNPDTNWQRVLIAKPYENTTIGWTYMKGFKEISGTTNIEHKSFNSDGALATYRAYFASGTYANLGEAQTALAGTEIYYQLETPIETEIEADGYLQGAPGGTLYVSDLDFGGQYFQSTTTALYYDNKMVSVAPNGNIYRWNVAVDNTGVASITTVKLN